MNSHRLAYIENTLNRFTKTRTDSPEHRTGRITFNIDTITGIVTVRHRYYWGIELQSSSTQIDIYTISVDDFYPEWLSDMISANHVLRS